QIVSRQEWLKARIALLEREKAWTRQRDQIAAERLALPWVRIEKDYVFAGPQGKLTLSDLFQGRSQLYIKHFMMAPGAQHQCVGCSLEVDHIAGILPHGEICQQRHLLVVEAEHIAAVNGDDADGLIVLEHGHGNDRTNAAKLDRVDHARMTFAIG